MGEGTRVASVDEVPEEEVLPVQVAGRRVALTRVGRVVYAFENDCSHMHCTFDDAEIDGDVVHCNCHGSAFDLRTGEATNPPATQPIPVFPVEVRDGDVYVTVE